MADGHFPTVISKDRNENSESNPIFVNNVEAAGGTPIHDYDTADSVAGDAASNHDYAVAGTSFLLKRIVVASSGGCKFEVQYGPAASLETVAVGFIPKQGGKESVEFMPPLSVPATGTGTVRIIRTNRQGQAQDLYSTIMGEDLA
jgi:hypothetical protein